MADFTRALSPLLNLGKAAQPQATQATTSDSLLAGLMAPMPQQTQTQQMRTNIGRLFGLDTRPPMEKLQEQLADMPLTTAADYANAAQVAKDLGLSAQAIQLSQKSAQLRETEEKTKLSIQQQQAKVSAGVARVQSVADSIEDPATKQRLYGLLPQIASLDLTGDDIGKSIDDILEQERESKLSPKERADLYKDFTPESIAAYEAGTGSLISKKKDIELTTDIKNIMLALGTADENDPRVRSALTALNNSRVKANEGLTPLQERTEVANYITNLPDYTTATEQYSRAQSIIEAIPTAEKEAGGYQLVAATMGQLYDNDLRAVAVVDKFLAQKDIGTKIQDWLLTNFTSIPSQESINTLEELAKTVRTYYERDLNQKINSASGLYSGVVDDSTIKVVQESLRTAAGLPSSTALPRQLSPDENQPSSDSMSDEELLNLYLQ
jgi:hypothetical protein